jgi:hypothetical protein
MLFNGIWFHTNTRGFVPQAVYVRLLGYSPPSALQLLPRAFPQPVHVPDRYEKGTISGNRGTAIHKYNQSYSNSVRNITHTYILTFTQIGFCWNFNWFSDKNSACHRYNSSYMDSIASHFHGIIVVIIDFVSIDLCDKITENLVFDCPISNKIELWFKFYVIFFGFMPLNYFPFPIIAQRPSQILTILRTLHRLFNAQSTQRRGMPYKLKN